LTSEIKKKQEKSQADEELCYGKVLIRQGETTGCCFSGKRSRKRPQSNKELAKTTTTSQFYGPIEDVLFAPLLLFMEEFEAATMITLHLQKFVDIRQCLCKDELYNLEGPRTSMKIVQQGSSSGVRS